MVDEVYGEWVAAHGAAAVDDQSEYAVDDGLGTAVEECPRGGFADSETVVA